MSSSTRSLLRLAEACTEAGLFIIPSVPVPAGDVSREAPNGVPASQWTQPQIAISVSADLSPQASAGGEAQAKLASSPSSWDTLLRASKTIRSVSKESQQQPG